MIDVDWCTCASLPVMQILRRTSSITLLNELVQFGQNFHFKIRRDHRKKSYHRRVVFEYVDTDTFYICFAQK